MSDIQYDFTKEAAALAKNLLPYILSGGAAAVGGGLLASRAPAREGESKEQRRKRILMNSLALGAGVGGAHAALASGLPKVIKPVASNVASGLERLAHGLKTNLGYYAGAGTAGAVGVGKLSGREERRNFVSARQDTHRKQVDDFKQRRRVGEGRPEGTFKGEKAPEKLDPLQGGNPRKDIHNSFGDGQRDHAAKGRHPRSFGVLPEERGNWRDQGVNVFSKHRETLPNSARDMKRNFGRKAIKEEGKLLFERATGMGAPRSGRVGPIGRSGKGRLAILATILGIPALTHVAAESSNPEAFADK